MKRLLYLLATGGLIASCAKQNGQAYDSTSSTTTNSSSQYNASPPPTPPPPAPTSRPADTTVIKFDTSLHK